MTSRPSVIISERVLPNPPPYSSPSSSILDSPNPIPPSESGPPSPATNFLHITRDNHYSIKGSYRINTLLTPPTALSSPPPDIKGPRPNLSLITGHANIDVKINLVGDASYPKAILKAQTKHSSIVVKMISDSGQKFSLDCTTEHSSISVYLPRNFVGPVRTTTKHGSVVFSPGVLTQLTAFSDHKGEAVHFIGNWVDSGYGEDKGLWEDEGLNLKTVHSKIKIYYIDEDISPCCNTSKNKGKQPFWKNLF